MASKIFVFSILSIVLLIGFFSFGDQNMQKSGSTARSPVAVTVEANTKFARAAGSALGEQFASMVFSSDIERLVVESDVRPEKFQTVIYLKRRLSDGEVETVSRAVKSAAGRAYKRVFVSFRVPDWPSSFWVSAHHEPDMKIVHYDPKEWSR